MRSVYLGVLAAVLAVACSGGGSSSSSGGASSSSSGGASSSSSGGVSSSHAAGSSSVAGSSSQAAASSSAAGNSSSTGGATCLAAGSIAVTNSGFSGYTFAGTTGVNPSLVLCRGNTYEFTVDAPGHPFWIKTVQGTGTANGLSPGVTGNGTAAGTVTFTVDANTPASLFYNCQIHAAMTGTITVL